MEANSSYLWDAELRRGNAGTWDSTPELLATCFANVPADIREVRVRADAGFGLNPVFDALESYFRRVCRCRSYDCIAETFPDRTALQPRQPRLGDGGTPTSSSELVQSPSFRGRPAFAFRRQRQPTLFALAVTPIAPGLPISPSPLSAFGISTMHARPSNLASASCWKITRYAKFPPAPSPPMHCSWKSFASPTIWSPPSNDSACKNPGNVSLFPSCGTSSSCCPANSPGRRIVPYCGCVSPPCCRS